MRPVPFSFDSGDPSFYGVYGSRLGYTKDGRSTLEPKYLKLSSLNLVGRSANRAKGTMVHEIGHWIDQQLVGPKLAGSDVGQFATTNQRNHPLMANWFRAVHQSRAYQQLDTAYEMARKGQRYTRVKADGTVTTGLYDQKYLDYARNDKELWARAYAQYIGRKTKDPDILEEMREESDKLVKRHHFTQWEDDDFDAIEEAFDRLFEGIGVMG